MINLIQLSDCHLFHDPEKSGYHQINPYQNLSRLLQIVVGLTPDIVLVTGDISGDDSPESYQHFIRLFAQFNMLDKLKVIPGNHDQNLHYEQALTSYSCVDTPINMQRWCLYGLDSRYQQTIGKIQSSAIDALERIAKQHQTTHFVVACHHHPIKCQGWMDNHALVDREDFIQRITQLSNVKLVVHGHIHMSQQTKIGGCDIVSCPSSCWQFAPEENFSLSCDVPGFNQFLLRDDGSICQQLHQ